VCVYIYIYVCVCVCVYRYKRNCTFISFKINRKRNGIIIAELRKIENTEEVMLGALNKNLFCAKHSWELISLNELLLSIVIFINKVISFN